MSSKLSEIVTKDDISLGRIIQRAIHMQEKERKKKIEGISRKTLYEIASEVGIEERYVERAIKEEKNYNIYADNNILSLAKILNLKDKNEHIYYKKRKVQKALLRILKKAKRFKPKIYTPEEIEAIYREKGINVKGCEIIKEGLNSHEFSEIVDNKGHKMYLLYKPDYGWD